MTITNVEAWTELRAWRQELTPETWVQHSPRLPGRRCAGVVAVGYDDGGYLEKEWISNEAWFELDQTLFLEEGIDAGLVRWNDKPGRTLAEVHSLFDCTIKRLEDSQDEC